jgi:hypothetical protein
MAMRKAVSSIPEYVEWVEQVFVQSTDRRGYYEAPWFRGAGDARFKLLPGLYRSPEGETKFADDELRSEFSRKALPLVAGRTPRDDWEWYFLMQHYRAPTRLLDWTDAALVALYFALTAWRPPNSSRESPSKPAVWALNPFALNRKARFFGPVNTDYRGLKKYLPRPYSHNRPPQYPIALDPNFVAQRMLVQHSHFTIHGKDRRAIDEMRNELSLQKGLFKVTIDADQDGIEYLQQQLAINGITETTIFPDLEGLARELRLEYRLDVSRPNMT